MFLRNLSLGQHTNGQATLLQRYARPQKQLWDRLIVVLAAAERRRRPQEHTLDRLITKPKEVRHRHRNLQLYHLDRLIIELAVVVRRLPRPAIIHQLRPHPRRLLLDQQMSGILRMSREAS